MDDFENKDREDVDKENKEEEQQAVENGSGEPERPTPYEPEPLPDMSTVPPKPVDEDGIAEEPPLGIETGGEESEEYTAKDESRFGRLARQGLRWFLGFFIVFGIGFLVALFVMYRPTVREMNNLQSELDASETQVAELQAEMSDRESQLQAEISDLESQLQDIEELQSQLDDSELQMLVMRGRLAVSQARIALFSENENQFSLYWDTTADTLSRIKERLPSDQQDAISSLEQRMILVADEFQESPEAAQSDLEIVGNRLLELQDTLFGGP